jgi:hypothetical protein
LNTGVSGETRRPFEQLEERVSRGDSNAVPTLNILLDASSLVASMGVVTNLPGLRTISNPANITSGGCGLGSSDKSGDAQSILETKVWFGDKQAVAEV